MSNDPVGRRPRSADLSSKLRLAALAAVVAGVVVLAAAAFVLSYEGIHQIALRAGVSPGLAKLYPVIFDVMLVIAPAAALALRGAGWWARCYAWALLLLLLVAVAIGNAVHATGTTLPAQPTKLVVAVTPWVLLLMAFGLLLEMLRHFRTTRSAAAKATAAAAVPASTGGGADVNGGPRAAAAQAAASGDQVRELPRVDLDTLLGPRAGPPTPIEVPQGTGAGGNGAHQADPVSYGEETGYVHPDSHLDEGEYSPHGDTGGPGTPGGQAGGSAADGTHPASDGTAAAGASATPAAETPATPAETPATAAPDTATSAGSAATPAETPAAPAETAATRAETPAAAIATPAETPAAPAESTATPAEATAAPAEATATPAEATATPTETPATSPGAAAPTTAAKATGSENGQGTGAGRAPAETPTGLDGTAEAGPDGNRVMREAGAEAPALERIRSSPTRPE
jgi:hypothetical protein